MVTFQPTSELITTSCQTDVDAVDDDDDNDHMPHLPCTILRDLIEENTSLREKMNAMEQQLSLNLRHLQNMVSQ